MPYLAFWQSGLLLASVPLVHWLWLRRSLGVSGRFSALVDELRGAGLPAPEPAMTSGELLAALRAATVEEFGVEAVQAMEAEPSPPSAAGELSLPRARERAGLHALFLVGLLAGGTLSAALRAQLTPAFALRSELFARIFGGSGATTSLVLLLGGVLVGFGTRMAGGCTSGHGLCGVSQFQKGSLLATAAFFGTGIATSFALRVLL